MPQDRSDFSREAIHERLQRHERTDDWGVPIVPMARAIDEVRFTVDVFVRRIEELEQSLVAERDEHDKASGQTSLADLLSPQEEPDACTD